MTRPDFTAHPYLGIIAAEALRAYRDGLGRSVTLPAPVIDLHRSEWREEAGEAKQ